MLHRFLFVSRHFLSKVSGCECIAICSALAALAQAEGRARQRGCCQALRAQIGWRLRSRVEFWYREQESRIQIASGPRHCGGAADLAPLLDCPSQREVRVHSSGLRLCTTRTNMAASLCLPVLTEAEQESMDQCAYIGHGVCFLLQCKQACARGIASLAAGQRVASE